MIEYSPSIEIVMKYLFGGIMICSELEVASQVAKKYGLTCITLQGDKVSF